MLIIAYRTRVDNISVCHAKHGTELRSIVRPNAQIMSQSSPQGNQRVDEAPVIQTKAKLNQVLTRGTAPDFGMESMFQSTRWVLIVGNHDTV